MLHTKLVHPSEAITCATGRAMGLHLSGMFKPCEDCALGRAKKGCMSKKAVEHSKILLEKQFVEINSSFSTTH